MAVLHEAVFATGPDARGLLRLAPLWVHPEHRRRGIGRLLLSEAFRLAADAAAVAIYVPDGPHVAELLAVSTATTPAAVGSHHRLHLRPDKPVPAEEPGEPGHVGGP